MARGILFVGPQPPPVGGVAEALERLAEVPALRSFPTDIFNTSEGEQTAPVGAKRLSFRAVRRRIRLVLQLAFHVLRTPPAILHYHFGSESLLNEIADFLLLYAGAIRGARVVLHLHIDPTQAVLPGTRRWTNTLFRVLARRAAEVFVLTENAKRFLESRRLVKHVTVLPNTCDERLLEIQRTYGGGAFRIAFLGRLTEAKGIFDLLEVAVRAKSDAMPWVFDLAGLPVSDGEREAIDSFVAEHSLTNVSFNGLVRGEAKIRFLASADAVFIPSHAESFGITAIEGMAAALPVVAARVGGLTAVVSEGETGVTVRAGDVDGFFGALKELAGSLELRRRYGAAGRLRFEREYSADRVGAVAAASYRRLLGT